MSARSTTHASKRPRDAVEASAGRIALKRARHHDASAATGGDDARVAFDVPPEWAKLAKEPCRAPLPAEMKRAFHELIHGDRTLRRVRDKYDGTLGPLQQAMTTKRLETAQALKEFATKVAQRQASVLQGGGGTTAAPAPAVEPRTLGSFFRVNPGALGSGAPPLAGGGGELDMEVEPIMSFVRKSVLRSGAKLNFDIVKEALESIQPEDVRAMVARLQAPSAKSRRKKAEPPEGWATSAFMKLLQARMHDLMYTTREDVEFRDSVPAKVMKQYEGLAGGEVGDDGGVPAADTTTMAKYREYLLAQRAYKMRSAAKTAAARRGNEMIDGVKDEILQYMLANNLRSRYLEPTVGGQKQPLFVRVKVRPPKVGKAPTVSWLRSTLRACPAFTTSGSGSDITADFLHGSPSAVTAFRSSLLQSVRDGFRALEQVEVSPAELYISVDYAKAVDGTDAAAKFAKVHMQ